MKTTPLKSDPLAPAFSVKSGVVTLKARAAVGSVKGPYEVALPRKLAPGTDYAIKADCEGLKVSKLTGKPKPDVIGGFHVGLDGQITSRSLWDTRFRPNCDDPRGMVFVPTRGWMDIYLLNIDPDKHGTSKAGVEIADGQSLVTLPDGKRGPLTYWNAVAVLAHYGKQLLSKAEFTTAMQGVQVDKTHGCDPVKTGHSAGLKSIYGIEQATGCMWLWSRDVDPSGPWVYIMGGSWDSDASGPRRFIDFDPADFWIYVGARGRCDHLIPGSEAKA